MSVGLADTSLYVASESGRPLRSDLVPDELRVSVITVAELRAGVLSAADVVTRDRRLRTLASALALEPVSVDDDVATAWARLRILLRDEGRRMPANDSWIAATAIALGIPVVTQDDDYDGAPGLDVIKV